MESFLFQTSVHLEIKFYLDYQMKTMPYSALEANLIIFWNFKNISAMKRYELYLTTLDIDSNKLLCVLHFARKNNIDVSSIERDKKFSTNYWTFYLGLPYLNPSFSSGVRPSFSVSEVLKNLVSAFFLP